MEWWQPKPHVTWSNEEQEGKNWKYCVLKILFKCLFFNIIRKNEHMEAKVVLAESLIMFREIKIDKVQVYSQ